MAIFGKNSFRKGLLQKKKVNKFRESSVKRGDGKSEQFLKELKLSLFIKLAEGPIQMNE